MDWPLANFRDVVAHRQRENEDSPVVISEYQMVAKFGLGFYDLDEITAQAFSLIMSIEALYQEREMKSAQRQNGNRRR